MNGETGTFSDISAAAHHCGCSGGEQLWVRDDAQCDCRTSYRASADCTALFRLSSRHRCLHAHRRGAAFFAHPIQLAEMLLIMLLFFAVNDVLVDTSAGGPSLRTMIEQHSYLPRSRATFCWLLYLAAAFHDHLLTLIIGPLIELPALIIIAQVMQRREKG
jgi:hypothetical protein